MPEQLTQASAQSPPQTRLACRLRKRTTERAAQRVGAGEVELENVSDDVLEIEYQRSVIQYLDMVVTDSQGRVLSDGCYGDVFSPTAEPRILRLKPGEKFVHPVSLDGHVPREKLNPGNYTVQAVYKYKGLRAVSEPYHLHLGPDDL